MRSLILPCMFIWAAASCQPSPGHDAVNDALRAESTAQESMPTASPEAKDPTKEVEKANVAAESLVIYSGRGAVLVEALFEEFTKETGIKVSVRYGKTGALAQQLVKEGATSPADLFFAQDSGYLGALDQAGLFAPMASGLEAQVAERYRPREANWLPTSGRARVLVYSPERVNQGQLPTRLEDLPSSPFKGRFGWAPTNSSLHAHVSALRSIWGEQKTEEWLVAMKNLKPQTFPKNSPQVRGVSAGEIDLGWVNHYYLHKLRAADPSLKAANHSFEKGDAGNLMMLSGVALLKASESKTAATKLIAFLLSNRGQEHFATKVFEYPIRDSVARHPDVPALGESTIRVEQTKLTDVSGTLALLRRLDIN